MMTPKTKNTKNLDGDDGSTSIDPIILNILNDYRDDSSSIANTSNIGGEGASTTSGFISIASSISSITLFSKPSTTVLSRAATLRRNNHRKNHYYQRKKKRGSSLPTKHNSSSSTYEILWKRLLVLLSFCLSCYVIDQTVSLLLYTSTTDYFLRGGNTNSPYRGGPSAADGETYVSDIMPDSPMAETTIYSKIDFNWSTKGNSTTSKSSSSPAKKKAKKGATLPLTTTTGTFKRPELLPLTTTTAGAATNTAANKTEATTKPLASKPREEEEEVHKPTFTSAVPNKLTPHTLGDQWRREDNTAAFSVEGGVLIAPTTTQENKEEQFKGDTALSKKNHDNAIPREKNDVPATQNDDGFTHNLLDIQFSVDELYTILEESR